jgi:hypothetical protein
MFNDDDDTTATNIIMTNIVTMTTGSTLMVGQTDTIPNSDAQANNLISANHPALINQMVAMLRKKRRTRVTYSPPHKTTPEWCQIPYPIIQSCIYIVYGLKYQIFLENSAHTPSYGEITFWFHYMSSDSLVLGNLWS